jgi:hypothetical protein
MDDFSFEDFNFGSGNEEYDFSGLSDIGLGTDLQELDLSSLFGGGGQEIDFSGLDNLDITNLLGTDFSQIPGDFGEDLGYELARTLQSTGQASSLFSDDGGFSMDAAFRSAANENKGDEESLNRSLGSKRVNLDEYERNLLGPGDFDQAAPPANIAELLTSMNPSSAENLSKTDFNALYNEGLTPEQIADREKQMDFYKDKTQDFGGADVMQYFDEYDKNMTDIMQNKGGFTSQWQDVGGNKVMINDDPRGGSTATVYNPTTEKTSFLNEAQTQALIANGTLNTKGSGYVAATGGAGYVPGGGKTIVNADGTKTVITPDGKVLKVDTDGKVTDTKKVVDVNNPKIETDPTKVVPPGVTPKTPTTPTKPTDKKDNNMLLALLALMAMMNKGGGSSTGSGGTIPSLQADRKQLPYGPASGSKARPGAGGVTYFSPTTYSQRAAGGGMMYGGGGISDLGGYSDGGRLLKGPGDGVSDSIPATIGGKQPARLATGEFVVPARIVSELGNGSTEAGAKKLYAMMDRVQKARRKTKNVAADTKAHKYLPA